MWDCVSLEPQNPQGSCWEEDSAVSNPKMQELNAVIYKKHSTQDQDQNAVLDSPSIW